MKNLIDRNKNFLKRDVKFSNVHTLSEHAAHVGEISNPSSYAFIKGPCGDEMEFFLSVKDKIVKEVKFKTNGCAPSVACGEVTSILAEKRTLYEAMQISAGEIAHNLGDLPESHIHCSILAVTTLYNAISLYLLKTYILGNEG